MRRCFHQGHIHYDFLAAGEAVKASLSAHYLARPIYVLLTYCHFAVDRFVMKRFGTK